MKRMTKILCVFLVVLGCVSVFAQSKTKGRKRSPRQTGAYVIPEDTIRPVLTTSAAPEFLLVSKSGHKAGNVLGVQRPWLVVEVSWSFNLPSNSPELVSYDNLRMEVYLRVADKRYYRWFYGVQTMRCVVASASGKTRKYYASVFMPPSYVLLYLPEDKAKHNSKERARRYNLKEIDSVILFANDKNEIIGRYVLTKNGKSTGKDAQALWNKVLQIRQSGQLKNAMLLPREKTPWQWYDANRFELPGDVSAKAETSSVPAPAKAAAAKAKSDDDEED